MTASHSTKMAESTDPRPVTVFGPDFPFPYDDWIKHPKGLGRLPPGRHGSEVAIIGAGMAGMVAAYGNFLWSHDRRSIQSCEAAALSTNHSSDPVSG